MIATKEYIHALQEKYDFGCFSTRETPPEAFVEWYNDHKWSCAGTRNVKFKNFEAVQKIFLKDYDLDSVIDFFRKDLEAMYD